MRIGGLVAHPYALHAPAVAVPDALTLPGTGRAVIGRRAAVVVSRRRTIVVAGSIVVRPRIGTADDGAGGQTADDAGGDGAAIAGLRHGRSRNGCRREGRGSSDGNQ